MLPQDVKTGHFRALNRLSLDEFFSMTASQLKSNDYCYIMENGTQGKRINYQEAVKTQYAAPIKIFAIWLLIADRLTSLH